VEYLLVTFDEDRGVIINSGTGAWRTNQILMLEAGTYVIALVPPANYSPPGIWLVLDNTTVIAPNEITFTKTPS
jgi:hypothetical protein